MPPNAKPYNIQGWSHKKDKVEQSMKHYQPIRHELAMINDTARKGIGMLISFITETSNGAISQLANEH